VDPSRPLVLAAARYASSNDAVRDYQIVWGARHGGAFDHMSVAVLAKDTRGVLRVGRHGSTAKDLALGGSVLSAALLIVAPAVDATVVAAADVVLPGAKGIAAHLWHVVPDEELQEVFPVTQNEHEGDVQDEHVEPDIPGVYPAVRAHGGGVLLTVSRRAALAASSWSW
jgi:hypothetical protein